MGVGYKFYGLTQSFACFGLLVEVGAIIHQFIKAGPSSKWVFCSVCVCVDSNVEMKFGNAASPKIKTKCI